MSCPVQKISRFPSGSPHAASIYRRRYLPPSMFRLTRSQPIAGSNAENMAQAV
jgi:hypothetical protein